MSTTSQPLAPLATGEPRKEATRNAYGEALLELGAERDDILVLDADLSGSTKTKAFGQAHPDRFFNIGVAEANMIGTAAGMAALGKTVFASSFAMFAAGKAWEQTRQSVCVPELSVKICATHAGLTVGEDGKSHQMLEDITLMRVLPHMRVLVPADGVEARLAVRAAAAEELGEAVRGRKGRRRAAAAKARGAIQRSREFPLPWRPSAASISVDSASADRPARPCDSPKMYFSLGPRKTKWFAIVPGSSSPA